MALFWRIWAAATLVNLIVLGIFVGLAGLQFASINSMLLGERLVVLANRTVEPFAAAARLGLPMSAVRNATALLERARQTDEDILALHVFDASGAIVQSTLAESPATISAEAAAARIVARGAPWYRETSDGFVGSVEISALDGGSAGGILIIYPGGGNLTQVRAMVAELLLSAFAALVLAWALGTIFLRYGLAGVIRQFEAIDTSYRDFERGAWRRGAGGVWTPVQDDATAFRDRLEAAAARYRTTGQSLEAAREEAG